MNSVNRVLVETIVRKALKDMKDSPKRSTRNLVDMALNFAEGRFQQEFFKTAQRTLENEQSAYYDLVQDVIAHVDHERLVSFGMNLGYNSCTVGAKRIREIEEANSFKVPWSLSLQIDGTLFPDFEAAYQDFVAQGKDLGIFTWFLFVAKEPQHVLSLVAAHPDCAFVLFVPPAAVDDAFLDEAQDLHHLAMAVRFEEGAEEACTGLRQREMLYALYYSYTEDPVEEIISGDIASEAEQLHPAFTIFAPELGTPEAICRTVYESVQKMRTEQLFQTILWDLLGDGLYIDNIISEDACSAGFDERGDLRPLSISGSQKVYNLFESRLRTILQSCFPRETTPSGA